jgi:RNA polymerase sporulation-specific sigma factor
VTDPASVNPADHLGLLFAVVNRFRLAGADRDELESEGYIALARAAGTFDPARGFAWSTYAAVAVRTHLAHSPAVGRRPVVRIPRYLDGRGPRHTFRAVLPGDARAPATPCRLEQREALDGLAAALAALDERARTVLTLRYGLGGGDPQTQRQVGARLGVRRGTVDAIEKRAVERLRELLGAA